MSRSLKKGPYINQKLYKAIVKLNESRDKKVVKCWDRASTIFPELVGHTVGAHNGKDHIPVYVSENMVGHKLGEFAATRKFHGHGGKKAAAEKRAAAQSQAKQQAAVMKN